MSTDHTTTADTEPVSPAEQLQRAISETLAEYAAAERMAKPRQQHRDTSNAEQDDGAEPAFVEEIMAAFAEISRRINRRQRRQQQQNAKAKTTAVANNRAGRPSNANDAAPESGTCP